MSRTHCRYSFSGSMMKRMSFSETIFLFVLALVIFGPKKLPEIARYIGKTLAEFRRASNEFKSQIEQEIANLDIENKKQAALPSAAAPAGTASRTLPAADVSSGASIASETDVQPEPATLASVDEPAPHVVAPATEALPTADLRESEAQKTELHDADRNHPDSVTSPTTQESHA